MKLWIFNWKNGGYNYVQASSKEDAVMMIKQKFALSIEILKVDWDSLHEGTWKELDQMEQSFAGMFD